MKKSILAILVAVLMASALLLTSCSQPVAMATLADLMDTSYVAEYDKMATELVKLNGMKKYDETTYQGSSTDGELLYFVGTETEYDEWGAELEITIIQVIYNVETDTVVWNNEVTYPIISEDKTTFTSVNFPSVGDADVFEIKTYEAYAPISDGSYAEIESTVLYDADGTVIVEKYGDVSISSTSSNLYIYDDALLYDDNGTVKVLGTIPAYNNVDVDDYDGTYLYSWGNNGFVAYEEDMTLVCEWQIDQSIGTLEGIVFGTLGNGMVLAQASVVVADTESKYDAANGTEKYRLHTYLINPADIEAKDAVKEIDVDYALGGLVSVSNQNYPEGYVSDGAFVALAYVCMIEDKVMQTSDMRIVALDAEAQIVFFAEIAANQNGVLENVGNGYYEMSTAAGTVILDENGEQVATYNGSIDQQSQKFIRVGNAIYDWTLRELVDLDDMDNAKLVGMWDTYFVYTVEDDDGEEITYYVGTTDGVSEMFTKKQDDTEKSYSFCGGFYTVTEYDEKDYTDSTVTIYTVTGEEIAEYEIGEYSGNYTAIGNGQYLIKVDDEFFVLK